MSRNLPVALCLLALVSACDSGSPIEPSSGPARISIVPGNLFFGDVIAGSTRRLTFSIHNVGTDVVTVTGLSIPSGYVATWEGGEIAPGGAQEVTLEFSPETGQRRRYDGTVTVDGNQTNGVRNLAVWGVGIPTYTLSGLVFEQTPAGQAPVEDVEVYCGWCGEFGHTFTYSDSNGRYGFSDAFADAGELLVRKDGYVVVGSTLVKTLTSDTRFDLELARR